MNLVVSCIRLADVQMPNPRYHSVLECSIRKSFKTVTCKVPLTLLSYKSNFLCKSKCTDFQMPIWKPVAAQKVGHQTKN